MKIFGPRIHTLGVIIALTLGACESLPFPSVTSAPATPKPVAFEKTKAPASSELIGGSVEDLTSWFGTPTLRRKDLDVEVWQYSASQCVALFFLYPDAQGMLRIDHLEARPRTTGLPQEPAETCFKHVAFEAQKSIK